jgi:tetratricopeptide (TPR) repeat protein
VEWYTKAVEVERSLNGEDSKKAPIYYVKLGDCYYKRKELNKAAEWYKKIVTVNAKIYGIQSKLTTEAIATVGACYKEMGQLELLDAYVEEVYGQYTPSPNKK